MDLVIHLYDSRISTKCGILISQINEYKNHCYTHQKDTYNCPQCISATYEESIKAPKIYHRSDAVVGNYYTLCGLGDSQLAVMGNHWVTSDPEKNPVNCPECLNQSQVKNVPVTITYDNGLTQVVMATESEKKLHEEYKFLSSAKTRAMGINEEFLSVVALPADKSSITWTSSEDPPIWLDMIGPPTWLNKTAPMASNVCWLCGVSDKYHRMDCPNRPIWHEGTGIKRAKSVIEVPFVGKQWKTIKEGANKYQSSNIGLPICNCSKKYKGVSVQFRNRVLTSSGEELLGGHDENCRTKRHEFVNYRIKADGSREPINSAPPSSLIGVKGIGVSSAEAKPLPPLVVEAPIQETDLEDLMCGDAKDCG